MTLFISNSFQAKWGFWFIYTHSIILPSAWNTYDLFSKWFVWNLLIYIICFTASRLAVCSFLLVENLSWVVCHLTSGGATKKICFIHPTTWNAIEDFVVVDFVCAKFKISRLHQYISSAVDNSKIYSSMQNEHSNRTTGELYVCFDSNSGSQRNIWWISVNVIRWGCLYFLSLVDNIHLSYQCAGAWSNLSWNGIVGCFYIEIIWHDWNEVKHMLVVWWLTGI